MSKDALTRRGFIGTGAAAGAGAVLSTGTEAADAKTRRAKPHRTSHSRHADVIVIGAGLAGLTAARSVARSHHSVIVLEARDRVGGRVWNHSLGHGLISERGGTFAGPTQDHILGIAKAHNVGTFLTYDTGQNVFLAGGQRQTYSDTGPTGTAPLDPTILPELTAVVAQLDQMATEIPVDAPWHAKKAAEYDGQTLETFIQNNSKTQRFRDLVSAATRPIFGAEPRDLSLLFVLFYIAASGNEKNQGTFERNFDTRDGAQMYRFVGGSQAIPIRMARALGRNRVLLRKPARRIVQSSRGVRVECDGLTVRGKRVIVAVPPTLAGRIDYHPALPPDRDQLTQRLGQGALTKVAASYYRPFWREKGLNGTAVSSDGLVSATFDDSPPSGKPGVLFGFVGGDSARAYARLSKAEKRRRVLEEFATLFGPEALHPKEYFDTAWTQEPWTRGCPVGIAGPGTLLAYGHALRPPVGRIHWAGTETSTYWNGYMDGAVRSGERAAGEVLHRL